MDAASLEEACRLGGTLRAGAICKGYIGDARKMEGMGRMRLLKMNAGHPRLPEACDTVVLAGTMWTLAGVWFVVWLMTWAAEQPPSDAPRRSRHGG